MGPTKAIVKGQALYDAVSDKLIQDGFANRQALEEYVKHHYIAVPVLDNAGKPWQLDGKPVYCLHGVQYETVDNQRGPPRPLPGLRWHGYSRGRTHGRIGLHSMHRLRS